jgi:hypothetical protein
MFLLSLNLLMAYLSWYNLSFDNAFSSIFINIVCFYLVTMSWNLEILLLSLHFLNESPIFIERFLNSWINAFYFKTLSLLSTKALSQTDFIVKFNVENTSLTCLHSLISFVLWVMMFHLVYIFLLPEAVTLINCITARFLNTWPY